MVIHPALVKPLVGSHSLSTGNIVRKNGIYAPYMEKPPGFVDHFVHFPREIYGYPTGYVSLLEGKLRIFLHQHQHYQAYS